MRWSRKLQWAAVLIPAAVLFLVFALLLPGWPSSGTIHIPNPRTFRAFLVAASSAGVAILVASLFSFGSAMRKKAGETGAANRTRAAILLSAFLLYLFCLFLALTRVDFAFSRWKARGCTTGASGDTWCFLSLDSPFSSLLPQVALGKLRSRTFLASSYRVMAESNLKAPVVHIPTPEGSSTPHGSVLISREGIVLGMLSGDYCIMAYDTKQGRALTGQQLEDIPADILTPATE